MPLTYKELERTYYVYKDPWNLILQTELLLVLDWWFKYVL